MKKKVAEEVSKDIVKDKEKKVKKAKSKLIDYKKLIETDFEKGILHLNDYSAVSQYKSVRRAIKRGHVSIVGDCFPHRPYKNIAAPKHSITYRKKYFYAQIKRKNRVY